MPYEIHAYCTSDTAPTIREFLEGLRYYDGGSPRMPADAPGESAKALDSSKWRAFDLVYGCEQQSLLLGCYRNTGPRSLCAKMARGRLETVSEYKDSPGKRRVCDCLANTRFVIWCRVDNDPDRERASAVLDLLAGFAERHGGVLDLEDEGFLADSDTPLCGWCAGDE
jgi:hypothetical protein